MNKKKIPAMVVLSFAITLSMATQYVWTRQSTIFLLCLIGSFLSIILHIKNKYDLEIKNLQEKLEKEEKTDRIAKEDNHV